MRCKHTLALAFVCILAACGGSTTSDEMLEFSPAPMPVEVFAPVVPDAEGYIFAGTDVFNAETSNRVGDWTLDAPSVAVFTFDLTGIGAVEQATLTLVQLGQAGTPFDDLGPLHLDHIDGGMTLDVGDQVDPPLVAGFVELVDQDTSHVDVTDLVAADLAAGRTTSSFRLRFEVDTDGNGDNDFVSFGTTKHVNPAFHPSLGITHVAP